MCFAKQFSTRSHFLSPVVQYLSSEYVVKSITSKTVKGQPQFTVRLTNWEPRATVGPSTFQFEAPQNATKVKTFPTSCGPGSQ